MKEKGISKSSIISKKEEIKKLFEKKKSVKKYPFLIYYLENDKNQHRFVASVPKRNFKKAVDRNQIKRKIKEIWRHNRTLIQKEKEKTFDLFIIYTGKEEMDYSKLEAKFIILLKELK